MTPATTAIGAGGLSFAQTTANYTWMAVSASSDPGATRYDLDTDGEVDHFLSFSVDFQQVVNQLAAVGVTGVDQSTAIQLAAGTSTNSSSINQNWAGPQGTADWSQPWSAIGGFSEIQAIPEPRPALQLALGRAALGRRRRCA